MLSHEDVRGNHEEEVELVASQDPTEGLNQLCGPSEAPGPPHTTTVFTFQLDTF